MPVNRSQKSIYFLSLEIENARCFAEEQVLNLVDSKGQPARWTLLVGDNGVGKTTLLQCLSWMRPTPYYPPGTGTQKGIQPWLNDRDTSDIAMLLRDGALRSSLRAKMVEMPNLASGVRAAMHVETGITLAVRNNTLESVELTENYPKSTVEPFIITYAGNRHMGRQNADELSGSPPGDLLREDNTELVDVLDVFSRLDYSALKGNAKSKARLDGMKQALALVLPIIGEVGEIDILDPKESSDGLRFRTQYGNVPLDGLSLGHRTVTAWIIDLAWRLIQHYPESTEPLAEPGVVLIDEIDLHLHPIWQRKVMKQFSDTFTNIQFVATTHSPLMITSMSDVNVAALKRTAGGDNVAIDNEPYVVEEWRFDQVLVNLFGLETARSLRVEDLMRERESLFEKHRITLQDRARLQDIAHQLSGLPTAERREDQEAMQIIRQAAADLRAQ